MVIFAVGRTLRAGAAHKLKGFTLKRINWRPINCSFEPSPAVVLLRSV